ncbi:MAG TPA: preprotein translocase subunit YajC [Ferruginibacter sp.]|jgi:preprotein translocase subunit YajC|nr:preprotein translocase subunit YajC [Ferruginibacter sp.]
MQLLSIFLMGNPGNGGSSIPIAFPMLGMIAVVYFFMIRPQSKKSKQQKEMINNLQKGDKIVTIAGIHGVINKVNEDGTINMEVSPGSYHKIEKSAISMEWTEALNKTTTTADKN